RLQLSFGFGISVTHWINLPRLHAASRSGVMSAHRSTGILPVGQTRVSPDYEFFSSAGKMPTGPTAKMAVLLIQPALRILLVVERNSLLSELECMLRVEHHRQLFCSRSVLARHDRAGMRPVWNPARMQRNRSWFNPATGPEIPAHVKQDFVRFNVVVHPRDSDRLRMRIEHAWRKCADDITANLECLMDRRRLVNRPGDRFEVLCIKCEWINVAIPADDIEW